MRLREAVQIGFEVVRLRQSQWGPPERVRKSQERKLYETLRFALDHVPHYRELGVKLPGESPSECLARFPILTKRDLQTAGPAILTDGLRCETLDSSRTSGSTGEPTVSYFDRRSWLYTKYALKARRMLNCGIGIGSRILIITEADEAELRSLRAARFLGQGLLFRQEYISLRSPLEDHVRAIRDLRPDAIYGFPSHFADLMDHCDLHNEQLPAARVIFTSSEVMPPVLRQRLVRHFGGWVCDVYGCTEFKEVAWQCEQGTYHVNHEGVWVETVGKDDPDAPGTLLLTTLVNRASPLIRYRVGDLGKFGWTSCACGRVGPSLSNLVGREVESLELPDGRCLSPYLLTTAVEDVPGIRQYQFVQLAEDHVELRYACLHEEGPDPAILETRLQKLLAGQLQVRIRRVRAIPRTSGGKRRVFVREFTSPPTTS